jgi:threonine/homoserine/homoserine lactone efflux protein
MVADVLKVLMAGRIRDKLTAGTIGIINKVSGTILIVFGISLLYAVIFRGDKFH